MITTRSFLAFALFRTTFESNCLNFSVLCMLFTTYWLSVIASASKASKIAFSEWFTISNVLSLLTTICLCIISNRAVGSGFVSYLDDSLSEHYDDLARTIDMIDNPVIVINHVDEKEEEKTASLLYANNQFSDIFLSSLHELQEDDLETPEDSRVTFKKLAQKKKVSTSSWMSILEDKT